MNKLRLYALLASSITVCTVTFFSANKFMAAKQTLLLSNIEALASNNNGEGNKFYYEHKEGNPEFCTLNKVFDASGNLKYSGEGDFSIEGTVGWTKTTAEGLRDKCPKSGSGCTAYSCQESN